jgi:hypothetical protein
MVLESVPGGLKNKGTVFLQFTERGAADMAVEIEHIDLFPVTGSGPEFRGEGWVEKIDKSGVNIEQPDFLGGRNHVIHPKPCIASGEGAAAGAVTHREISLLGRTAEDLVGSGLEADV